MVDTEDVVDLYSFKPIDNQSTSAVDVNTPILNEVLGWTEISKLNIIIF